MKKKSIVLLFMVLFATVGVVFLRDDSTISLAQLWSPLQPPMPDARTMNSPLHPPPTPTALPPAPTATPRITPTPPHLGLLERLVPYDARIPLRSENITLAAVQPFDVGMELIFKAWSPNGEQFLFGRTDQRHILVRFANGAAANGFWTDLWVADRMNSEPQLLARLVNDWAWSPDGRYVAYLAPAKPEGIAGKLYVVDLNNLKSWELTDCDLGGLDDLTWLPTNEITCRQNGVMYAVSYSDGATRQLNEIFTSDSIIDPTTKETLPPVFQGHYRVSPDGKKIAYIRRGFASIWIANLDGSNTSETKFEGTPYINHDWAWSPDSTELSFSAPNSRGNGLGANLWVVNVDTNTLRPVAIPEDHDVQFTDPTWSPDGQVIAFTYRTYAETEYEAVWVVDRDGKSPHLLVEVAFAPLWAPTGNAIAILRERVITGLESHLILMHLGQ